MSIAGPIAASVGKKRLHPTPCYSTIQSVNGPIVVLENVKKQHFSEIVKIHLKTGETRTGKILEANGEKAVLQVFEGTEGLDTKTTTVEFLGEVMTVGVTRSLLGRTLSGSAKPIDGGAEILAEEFLDIEGSSINPCARRYPKNCLETGISSIDILMSICQGQKILLLSGSGMPYNPLLAAISRNARVCVPWERHAENPTRVTKAQQVAALLASGQELEEDSSDIEGESQEQMEERKKARAEDEDTKFCIVFAGIGLSHEQAHFFQTQFTQTGAINRSVILLNLASDPVVERIATPRIALTIAEYFAFKLNYHVLVLLSDMFNYCDALRQISSARNEVPGRKSYPSYLYSDLATIYERAGRVRGSHGSITQIPLITLPNDDISHVISDLSGFITEGQIFQDRKLFNRSVLPAIDPLPSLSRLQKSAIGPGKTRDDHPDVANQIYASYAIAKDVLSLKSIVGVEGLSESDLKYLQFLEIFEERFLKQDFDVNRSMYESLDLAWECLRVLPVRLLSRCNEAIIEKYYYLEGGEKK